MGRGRRTRRMARRATRTTRTTRWRRWAARSGARRPARFLTDEARSNGRRRRSTSLPRRLMHSRRARTPSPGRSESSPTPSTLARRGPSRRPPRGRSPSFKAHRAPARPAWRSPCCSRGCARARTPAALCWRRPTRTSRSIISWRVCCVKTCARCDSAGTTRCRSASTATCRPRWAPESRGRRRGRRPRGCAETPRSCAAPQ